MWEVGGETDSQVTTVLDVYYWSIGLFRRIGSEVLSVRHKLVA